MLKALYDYAVRNDLVLPPGYVNKTIKAYILLSAAGAFLGFVYPENGDSVVCPDIGSLANGTDKCNVLAEKRSVVLPEAPNAKSDFFCKALESGGEMEPMLAVCLSALRSTETCSEIKRAADREKLKASDRLCFMVDGTSVLESPALQDWWKEYRRQFAETGNSQESLCLITGEPTVPMKTVPPVSGLQSVGGHARGDALICFDKAAFCSYNLKQAANAPVSEEAFAGVKAALDHLISKAPTLAGMKFIHWYDKTVSSEDDPFTDIFGGFSEDDGEAESNERESSHVAYNAAAERGADRLVLSVESGQETPPLPHTYYILLLSGVGGRVMIRRWEHGSYEVLQANIKRWREDISLLNLSGTGKANQNKLSAMLIRLLARQKSDSRVFERLGKELPGITPAVMTAILAGGLLPDTVVARALAYIRSQMMDSNDDTNTLLIPDAMCCQWLKAWLLRKRRSNDEEEDLMAEYNPENTSAAYHCGAIMAVYAAMQKEAMPEVNAGVIQRYYTAASQTPALVLGRLNALSNYHLDKIVWKWAAELYNELLDTSYCSLGNSVPVTLNLEQQAYFALGYRQMSVEINRRKKDKYALLKEKKAQKAPNDTTEEEK